MSRLHFAASICWKLSLYVGGRPGTKQPYVCWCRGHGSVDGASRGTTDKRTSAGLEEQKDIKLITLSWIQAHVQSARGAAGAHDKELTNACCPGAHGGVCMAAIPRRVVVLAALQPSRTCRTRMGGVSFLAAHQHVPSTDAEGGKYVTAKRSDLVLA